MKMEIVNLLLLCFLCKLSWASIELPVDVHQHYPRVDFDTNKWEDKRGVGTRDLVRMFLNALHSKESAVGFNGNSYGRVGGIPFRPARKIGSEFLGKRSVGGEGGDESMEEMKRAMGSEFLGKRYISPLTPSLISYLEDPSLSKRAMGSEFLGKRRFSNVAPDWAWKRNRLGSEFLGKRAMGSEFLGKRGSMGSEFLGKRASMGSEFLGKRGSMGSEFLGKRGSMGSEFLGKRGSMGSEFLGKRGSMGSEFLGKRGSMGSEFLGKKSTSSFETDWDEVNEGSGEEMRSLP